MPGEAVAIVGATGAGKSTLVSLLPRFYDPREGRILLDGRDIKSITLSVAPPPDQHRPAGAAAVFGEHRRQHPLRPARRDDGRDCRGGEGRQRPRLRHGAAAGYDTLLGERGAQLSGGERQRIAVARAFLKNAPILILDEPTSSIDSKTEAVILDALDRLMVGRTTFLVAHRLSTLRSVSKILVLDQGRIVEQGTHDELLRHDGVYRQLYDIQAGQSAPSAAALEPVPAGSI